MTQPVGIWLVAAALLSILGSAGFLVQDVAAQSEEAPQLLDPLGDVEYDSLYMGTQEHPYVDIIAGWVRTNNATDESEFVFNTASNEAFKSPETQWAFTGEFWFRAFAGADDVGEFIVQYQVDAPSPVYSAVFLWNASVGVGSRKDFDHRFEMVNETPGYARFVVSRPELFLHFDRLEQFRASMVERLQVGVLEGSIQNVDGGETEATIDLRRERVLSQEAEDESASNAPTSRTDTGVQTPFPSGSFLFWVFASLSFLRYVRRRPRNAQ